MADEKILIKIQGDTTSINKSLKNTQKGVEKTSREVDDLSESFAKVKVAAVAGFAAIAGGAAISVKNFAKFENELLGVKTLLNESSFGAKGLEKGFSEMRGELLQLGRTAPVSISSLNKALFDTISAGVDASDAVEAVGVSARLATAGLTDVSVATDGITSALNAYELSASEAESVASKFFAAQVAGKTTIEELSNGFGLVGASANAFGVSLDELLAATSAVTTAGIKTNSAYTGLNAVLANVAKPTADAAKEAKRLGIEFNSTALRTKGLKGFLEQLTQAQGFNKQSIEKLFGSVEAQKIAFALTGAQAETFADTLTTLSDKQQTSKTFNDAYTTSLGSTQNQLTLLSNKFEALSINIGEKLAPALIETIDLFNTLFNLDNQQKARQISNEVKNLEEGIARLQEKVKEAESGERGFFDSFFDSRSVEELNAQIDENLARLEELKAQKASGGADDDIDAKLDKKTEEAEAIADKQAEIDEAEKTAKQAHEDALATIEKGRITTVEQAKRDNAKDDLKAQIKENNLRIKEEQRFGKAHAKTLAFFRSKNVEGFGMMLDNLATLGASGNKTLGRIAQVASVARAFMNTAEGVTKALTFGPILGPILASTVAAAGAVQIATIKSQKFAQGGLVTGGIPGVDSVPAMLQQGEMVVPRENFEDVIARFGGNTEEDGRQQVDVNITMSEGLVDFIEAELAERSALNTGV